MDHSKFKRLEGKTRMAAPVYASLKPLAYEAKDLSCNQVMAEIFYLTPKKEQS